MFDYSCVMRAVKFLYPLELQQYASEKSNKRLMRCCHNDDLADSDKQNLSSDGVKIELLVVSGRHLIYIPSDYIASWTYTIIIVFIVWII